MTIPVAHDFSCAWCWIGLHQAQDLKREFGVAIEWRGYELYPETMLFPPPPPSPVQKNRPRTPSRMQLAYAAQGMEKPTGRGPSEVRTHAAHEAVELAKLQGTQDALVDRIYRAYWEEGADIGEIEIVLNLAQPFLDRAELNSVLTERRFAENIVAFDEASFATGVYNVPTFWIGGERYAEMPYVTVRRAVESLFSAVS